MGHAHAESFTHSVTEWTETGHIGQIAAQLLRDEPRLR
jgi:hypothetical protein